MERVFVLRGGTVTLVNDGSISDDNKLNIESESISIPSGAYSVDISYDSTVNEDKKNESNANVSISSKWVDSFDTVTLDDQNNTVSGRLWVPLFTACDDLKVNISYNGNGTLKISNITITESLRYRLMRIVGIFILFIVADFLILTFFSSVKVHLKKRTIFLLIIIITSSIPFFATILFGGHDLWFHTTRIASISEELQNGQFPVRMSTELNNGYGYPTSIYYCDIFLYPVAFLYSMFVPLRICYQVYVIMINVATTIFTYISISKITQKEHLRLLGTGLYVLCIYRLVNVNIRAAAGEYTAMAFLPLIIAGIYLIYTKESPTYKDWLYLTFGMSGVIMSHVLTAELIIINLVLLFFILIKKTLKKKVLFSLVKAMLLSLGITAWFLIPFLDYFTNQVTLVQQGALYLLENSTKEFIFLFQLFTPGSRTGGHIALGMPLVAGIVIILYCLAKYKSPKRTQQEKAFCIMSGFAFMNIIFVSKYFPWGRIQKHLGIDGLGYQIGTMQFSWRFLAIASVVLVFAIIMALNLLENKKKKSVRIIILSLLGCIVLSTGFFYYKYADEVEYAAGSYNMVQPYTGSDDLYLLDGTNRTIQNKSVPEVITGKVVLSEYYKCEGVYNLNVDNLDNDKAVISVPIYGYRYYNAYDDMGVLLETELSENNCVAIKIPANYSGNITVKFMPPYSWRIAEVVSLVCIIFVIGMLTLSKLRSKGKLTTKPSQ